MSGSAVVPALVSQSSAGLLGGRDARCGEHT